MHDVAKPKTLDQTQVKRLRRWIRPALYTLLASPLRPTWIVEAQTPTAFGLDRSGQTARLLARYYRRAARPCGRPVLLARTAGPRPDPGLREPCRTLPADGFDLDF